MITLSKRKIFIFCAGFTFALGMVVAFGTAFLMSAPGIKDTSTIPQLVSYQGTLTDKNGVPVNGTFEMCFAVYDTESGGLPLGEKVCIPDVEIKDGCFIVLLPIAQLVQSGEPKYLEISIDGQTLMPRQQIASVFYALKAGDALTLQGKIPDDFAPLNHKHSGDDITSAVAQAKNADTIDGKHTTDLMLPKGSIMMWAGSIGSIPAGWALCDGTNGTPDLRNKFVVAAGGSYAIGNTGGSDTHIHGSGSYTGPSHTHGAGSYAGPSHTHDQNMSLRYDEKANEASAGIFATSGNNAAMHTANVQGGQYTKVYTGVQASGTGPVTGTSAEGGTGPITGTSGEASNLPPYYALAFIMKL